MQARPWGINSSYLHEAINAKWIAGLESFDLTLRTFYLYFNFSEIFYSELNQYVQFLAFKQELHLLY